MLRGGDLSGTFYNTTGSTKVRAYMLFILSFVALTSIIVSRQHHLLHLDLDLVLCAQF